MCTTSSYGIHTNSHVYVCTDEESEENGMMEIAVDNDVIMSAHDVDCHLSNANMRITETFSKHTNCPACKKSVKR